MIYDTNSPRQRYVISVISDRYALRAGRFVHSGGHYDFGPRYIGKNLGQAYDSICPENGESLLVEPTATPKLYHVQRRSGGGAQTILAGPEIFTDHGFEVPS